ncbi:MAG: hypothetical protein ACI83O_000145 [Patescibacteria group bacterium]|jgi:hypothetical protein
MVVRRLADIEREKKDEKLDEMSSNINRVVDGVFPSKKKKKFSWFSFFLKSAIGLVVLLVLLNFILANAWLLRFFWVEFFG